MAFDKETFQFLADLAKNNSKAWFDDNRSRYEDHWLEPAKDFVIDWNSFMDGLSPVHKCSPKVNGSIRRINRDVRFSKDKTPYSPKIHLVFWCGDHPNRSPAIHVVVHPDRLGMGVGQWAMTADELAAFRSGVADNKRGAQLSNLVEDLKAEGLTLTSESLKRLPSGVPDGTGRDTFFKRKGLVLTTGDNSMPLSILKDRAGLERIFTKMARIDRWLMAG